VNNGDPVLASILFSPLDTANEQIIFVFPLARSTYKKQIPRFARNDNSARTIRILKT
jgi:hypothetical protein